MRAADVLALRAPCGDSKSFALIAVVVAMFYSADYLISPLFVQEIADSFQQYPALARDQGWPLAIIAIGIVGPIAEEFWIRGFLLPALARTRLTFWGAGLLTSAIFAALHFPPGLLAVVHAFFVGLVLTWALAMTGSLYIPIVIHMLNNLAVLLIWRWSSL